MYANAHPALLRHNNLVISVDAHCFVTNKDLHILCVIIPSSCALLIVLASQREVIKVTLGKVLHSNCITTLRRSATVPSETLIQLRTNLVNVTVQICSAVNGSGSMLCTSVSRIRL
jgi:hypothetical protein